jgi:hypothetical protein
MIFLPEQLKTNAAVISDLKDAAAMLPVRSGIGEGRATAGAAMLCRKVYLTTRDYAAAKLLLMLLVTLNTV